MISKKSKITKLRRRIRIRKKLSGTAEKPRMSVNRSLNHIYVQLVDDVNSKTLASASTLSKEIVEEKKVSGRLAKSKLVGELAAKKALEAGIKTVVFDRGIYKYHGRVKALAEGAREGGLKF